MRSETSSVAVTVEARRRQPKAKRTNLLCIMTLILGPGGIITAMGVV